MRETTANARAEATREFSETGNQFVRRLRTTTNVDDALKLLVEASAPLCELSAAFTFLGTEARLRLARGFAASDLAVNPAEAAAFLSVLDTKDPAIALGTAPEVSPVLSEAIGRHAVSKIHLYPLVVRDAVHAIFFAAGLEQPAAVELWCEATAMHLQGLIAKPQPKVEGLISLAASAELKPTAASWEALPPREQQLHLRAQRMARVAVAEMRLNFGPDLRAGRERSDIYGALRTEIEGARNSFRKDFLSSTPGMLDYLNVELIRTLATDDERLMGPDYPGPLV